MTVLQAFWFGLVQGLTEFLPISSSGHLVLIERLFGISSDSMLLEVFLHIGTLAAIGIVYWREFLEMIRHPLKSDLWKLVLATLPAVIVGFALNDFDARFKFGIIGWGFLLTTLILWLSDLISGVARKNREVSWFNALGMGLMQAVALLPGVSRSGSTISGGIATGLSRRSAADFSFMMAVPVTLGSMILTLPKLFKETADAALAESPLAMLVAVATSFVVGFLAIKFMLKVIRRIRISWFGVYTGLLGAFVLLDQYFFHFYFS